MLFITNRFLNEGLTPQNPQSLPRSVSFARDNRVDQSVYFCRRDTQNNYTEIGRQAFFERLQTVKADRILFYIHGFNNQPEPNIFPTAAELQTLFDEKARDDVFVVPILWPCDDDRGILKDYFDDRDAADGSRIAFMRLFEMLRQWQADSPHPKPMNVLAHSMGNRVLRGALQRSVERSHVQGLPQIFRHIYLVAPDIEHDTLEPGREGSAIATAAERISVYFANDDLALNASKVVNLQPPIHFHRLGRTGPKNLQNISENIHAFDCGSFNTDYDRPTGHGYFTRDAEGNPGLLFEHLWECLRSGSVPTNPSPDGTTPLTDRFWQQ